MTKEMTKKAKLSHRAIAIFLVFTFLPSLIPINFVFASSAGPTAPEASSFEPVDATDMVNLGTGDLSYVLPLLNVPSPEGGYPISLSYHAGIGLDQEASWVGLGWNINPGAINRSVNGYPDDWNNGKYKEYFYDIGGRTVYETASIGYTGFSTGFNSASLNMNWVDGKATGGSVSFGYGINKVAGVGISAGTDGFSANANIGLKNSNFSIGGSIGTNGAGIGVGYDPDGDGKGLGGRLGLNSSWSGDIAVNGSFSRSQKGRQSSLGIDFSSQGVGLSTRINGTGANFSFGRAIRQGDYNIDKSGYFIPIFIPLYEGGITASYGKQVIEYDLDVIEENEVSGPLYFSQAQADAGYWVCRYCNDITNGGVSCQSHVVQEGHVHLTSDSYNVRFVKTATDVYEVDVRNSSQGLELDNNNAVFPNYDNYRVTAQGLSGSMKPKLYENGALLGLSKKIEENGEDGYNLNYFLPSTGSGQTITQFNSGVDFNFDNEYSSSLIIDPVSFNMNNSANEIYDYLDTTTSQSVARKKGGRFVESFTNAELSNTSAFNTGLLKANATTDYSNVDQYEPDGIGAFKITSADGKTYHYAQPVYNHEIVSRQFGMSPNNPNKDDAFFEKRQLKKYATHWLLTAITGPDFVDSNQNNIADEGDYGYWVMMDYGKWSDGYVWYAPHGEEYRVAEENANLKYYTWGRKEIYYLDKVKTRTHTALFVKEQRNDNQGKRLFYKHRLNASTASNMDFKAQTQLRLKEIMLLKNEDADGINKINNASMNSIPSANFSENISWYDPVEDGGGTKTVSYSLEDNVLDSKDVQNWNTIREKSLKVVDFSGYSYELANGAPFTYGGIDGRLTLKNVTFKGRGGVQLMPSYRFDYNQGAYILNQKDEWGFDKFSPQKWSLKEIKMPTGGKIQIEYEPDTFHSAINHDNTFDGTVPDSQDFIFIDSPTDFSAFGINLTDKIDVSHRRYLECNEINEDLLQPYQKYMSYDGKATVVQFTTSKRLKLKLDNAPQEVTEYPTTPNCSEFYQDYNYTRASLPDNYISSGVRVKSIKTTDGINEYRTEYDYDIPGTNKTSGIVSYIPFANKVDSEVPYGIELPAAVPMYGNVRTTAYGNNNISLGYNDYEFKVLAPKNGHLTFGDVLEMKTSLLENGFNTANSTQVRIEASEIVDNTATLGQLLSTSQYNNKGQLLSKTTNTYATKGEIEQGITREAFQSYKEVDYISNSNTVIDKWLINSSSRVIYPSALKSTTVLQGGLKSTTYFDRYDSTSGQLLETRTERSDGLEFKTESVPAFTKYPSMGSKVDQLTNKNMLVQNAMNKTYIKHNDNWRLTGAAITTWDQDTYFANSSASTDVWRKRKNYRWEGQSDAEGLFTSYSGDDDGFDWINDNNSNTEWRQISEISKYDEYSMPLEAIDINGNESMTKMGDKDSKILAVGNGAFNEVHYSGAEYLANGEFNNTIDGYGQSMEQAHTGKYSVKITSDSQKAFETVLSGYTPGKYRISVWYFDNDASNTQVRLNWGNNTSLSGGEVDMVKSGQWKQVNFTKNLDGSDIGISITALGATMYFDDFRIHPVNTSMNSYVYNDWGELTDILDANNVAVKYEYDAQGRLVRTFKETMDVYGVPESGGFKKVAENVYQYSQNISSTIEPLFVSVTYGASTTTSQEFKSTVTGGSGNYSFKWYNGIGSSSSDFESTFATTSPNYNRTNISGCNIRYVKLVVTDNIHGYLGESVRIVRNNNPCDPNDGENQQ